MTKYSAEFKWKVVQEYLKGDIGYQTLAHKYNILLSKDSLLPLLFLTRLPVPCPALINAFAQIAHRYQLLFHLGGNLNIELLSEYFTFLLRRF